ncbi:PQQ-binding-like beta-propeller repeat protein [Cohnella hashimotonis]|uniref:PQQ-binding-like beta-propeller repeat protein n=1 Tax=Cohnella hashimotonis TaxID=2826895 RepID=A0ABT6TGI9_9BACL|nr:PQQ-binding-like beta-propeller repeat protein [Cohnella hashimotonis]MDI4645869.1 PQQ-binding-like beta-propeller repeat protein [Cohnella hashimotonis]
MKKGVLLSLVALSLLAAGCSEKQPDSTETKGEQKEAGFFEAPGYAFGYHLGELISGDFQPYAEGNVLYMGGIDGSVTAVDIAAKKKLWSTDPVSTTVEGIEMADNANGISADDNALFVSGSYSIRAYNKVDGGKLWQKQIGQWTTAAPLRYDDKLIAGIDDGSVLALDPKTGDEIWSAKQDDLGIRSEITEKDGVIYVYGNNGILIAADASSGKMKWQTTTLLASNDWNNPDNQIAELLNTKPVFYANLVIIGSWDGNVYGIDRKSGSLVWETRTDKVTSYPLLDGDTVYTTTSNAVHALDAKTGEQKWTVSFDQYLTDWHLSNLAASNGKLYVAADKTLLELDSGTGESRELLALSDDASGIYLHDGLLFIALFHGDVLAKALDE